MHKEKLKLNSLEKRQRHTNAQEKPEKKGQKTESLWFSMDNAGHTQASMAQCSGCSSATNEL